MSNPTDQTVVTQSEREANFFEELQTLCERHGVEMPGNIKITPDGAPSFTKDHIKALAGFLRWWYLEGATMEDNTLRACFRPCAKPQGVELTGDLDIPIIHENIEFAEGSSDGNWPLLEFITNNIVIGRKE